MRLNNKHTQRDKKREEHKRDAASSTIRFHEGHKTSSHFNNGRDVINHVAMERYRLNDLYERSSI